MPSTTSTYTICSEATLLPLEANILTQSLSSFVRPFISSTCSQLKKRYNTTISRPLRVRRAKKGKKYPLQKKNKDRRRILLFHSCYIYPLAPPTIVILFYSFLYLYGISLRLHRPALASYPQPSGLPPGVVAGFVVVVVVLANFTIQPQTHTQTCFSHPILPTDRFLSFLFLHSSISP